ncbi:protein TBATA-like [Diretmus argenteus]
MSQQVSRGASKPIQTNVLMWLIPSPDSQRTTGERSTGQDSQVPFTTDFTKMLTKSSPRFGTLSHHSFFSRHNPHPHRVRHIQALVSEAWREELKELAAKVSLSSQAKKDKQHDQPEEGFGLRKTQYSAQTGRIIPPSAKTYHRRSLSRHPAYPHPFYDQELMVFELLCQILQTDSLSLVQQWLLLAGQREKDLVMGLIQQALEDIDVSGHQQNFPQVQALHPCTSLSVQGPSFGRSQGKPLRARED